MKASLGKRMSAYLIDLIILLIILGLIGLLYKPDVTSLTAQMDNITLKYANGDISFTSYMTDLSFIYKQIDTINIFLNLINVLYIIAYFVILPYLNHGQTIGKKLMNIEVKARSNQSLSLTSLLIRNLIINGLLYFVTVIICCLIIPDNIYFTVITILGLIQLTLLFISIIMTLTRRDKRGLHDILDGTWVATTK